MQEVRSELMMDCVAETMEEKNLMDLLLMVENSWPGAKTRKADDSLTLTRTPFISRIHSLLISTLSTKANA